MSVINNNHLYKFIIFIIINKGKIFWIVDNKNKTQIEHLFKIEINQPWKGEAPSFTNIANLFIIINLFLINKQKITPNKKIMEAHLWIIKYFIVFSKAIPGSEDMIGKKANIFISRHSHIMNEELELINIIIAVINTK